MVNLCIHKPGANTKADYKKSDLTGNLGSNAVRLFFLAFSSSNCDLNMDILSHGM